MLRAFTHTYPCTHTRNRSMHTIAHSVEVVECVLSAAAAAAAAGKNA